MKKNVLRETTELAKVLCEKYIDEETVAVDGTCGKGYDTLWLAQRCSKVYAFDIQKEAAETTRRLIEDAGMSNVEVINKSHHLMGEHIDSEVNLFMFNLGYLPGGDKNVTTKADTTIKALEAALSLLAVNGLICIIMYWGHPQGAEERKDVLSWASQLDKGCYHCVHTDMINQPNCPPEILLVTKKH